MAWISDWQVCAAASPVITVFALRYDAGMSWFRLSLMLVFLIPGCDSAPQPTPPAESAPSVSPKTSLVLLKDDVVVDLDGGRVLVPAIVSLEEGWLEVIACIAGTREHESIVVINATPSVIHAGLLLAGAKPGRPGGYDAETGMPIPPTGDGIDVLLEWVDPDGGTKKSFEITELIDSVTRVEELAYVFAGSRVAPNPPSLGPGEHYVADYAGTVVGLATFGDELIAAREVRSPEESVDPPAWKIRPGLLPSEGTEVEMVLKIRR